jgi:DNA-binding cell septation regulator SpoVG
MEVTRVDVILTGLEHSNVLAYADIILDNELAIKGVKVVQTQERKILSMPSKVKKRKCTRCNYDCSVTYSFCPYCGDDLSRVAEGKIYMDVVHPVNNTLRDKIERAVLSAYKRILDEKKTNTTDSLQSR